MLGIAALAQLALAQFPPSGAGVGVTGLAWRRWAAQESALEACLNQNPDPEFLRELIGRMMEPDQEPKPWWVPADEDEEEEIIAILMASIH